MIHKMNAEDEQDRKRAIENGDEDLIPFMPPTVIIEQHNTDGVEWVFSMDGPNPRPEECIVLKSHFDAQRVKQWYDGLLKAKAAGVSIYNHDWNEHVIFALENVP